MPNIIISPHTIMEQTTLEELHSTLISILRNYNIVRFQRVFFPPSSLYQPSSVEYKFHGYDDNPEFSQVCIKAFSTHSRIACLREKLNGMFAPIFGGEFFYKGVLTKEDAAPITPRPSFITQGLIIPLHGPKGFMGMIGLGVNRVDVSDTQVRELHLFCMVVFQRYCELHITQTPQHENLTPREIDLLRYLVRGKTNFEIAAILKISKYTVNGYLRSVFIKLGVHDRVSAAIKARELGLHINMDDLPDMLGVSHYEIT